ncbi:hypothetical protein MRX96_013644 [Rhipicephalus microplus]
MTTEALRPPDEYDVAVEMLSKHFATPCNVRLQRHRFRERCQLQEVQEIVPEEDATSVISILAVRTDKSTGVYLDVNVASVTATTRVHTMNFLVDTGSAMSIMGMPRASSDEFRPSPKPQA